MPSFKLQTIIMDQSSDVPSRKKFLLWGTTLFSSLVVLKFLPGSKRLKKEPETETVKMLTQDGKLIEINKKLLVSTGKKISNEELQKWIKK